MEAKEKAKQLLNKMHKNLYSDGIYDAKQCALICVDELINSTQPKSSMFRYNEYCFEYWEEVKQEIEKL